MEAQWVDGCDQRGTDGSCHDQTFLLDLGHVALIKSALPITPCPEKESSRGRSWCRKRMEDVTNHEIYDKTLVSTNHANNLECVSDHDTVSAA